MVFLAEQASLGRLVAVKLLRPGLILSVEADARLSREAQVLARLRHPNIVTAFAFGHDRGVHYLAMEYVEGAGLERVLARGARQGGSRPTVVQVTGWCRDVARALEAAHEAGIVHRDVKPSNIRITPRRPGGARGLRARARPPRQHADDGRRLPRLAAVLLAGADRSARRRDRCADRRLLARSDALRSDHAAAPFEGSTTEAVFARILSGDVEAPPKIAPATPARGRNRHPRPRSSAIANAATRPPPGFARDLEALLELRDILARPPGAREARAEVDPATAGGPRPSSRRSSWRCSRRRASWSVRTLADRRAFAREAAAASDAAGARRVRRRRRRVGPRARADAVGPKAPCAARRDDQACAIDDRGRRPSRRGARAARRGRATRARTPTRSRTKSTASARR